MIRNPAGSGTKPALPQRSRLLLLGGGHAHLRVLEALRQGPWPGCEVSLLSPSAHHHYSGMVPGFLAGRYRERDLRFDLAALSRAAGVRFVEASAERVVLRREPNAFAEIALPRPAGSADRENGRETGEGASGVVLADGRIHPFDLLSVDIGSTPIGSDLPGVREHALSVRPMHRAVALRERLDAAIRETETGAPVPVTVVGGGAAGFEVALALEARIAGDGRRPEVGIVEGGPELLPGFEPRVRRIARKILTRRGVSCATGRSVVRVTEAGGEFRDGGGYRARFTVWLTGAAPPPLLSASTLPLGPTGFLHVDAGLRVITGDAVWGAGDCIELDGHPEMPRAGVYAVRQGPHLARALEAAVRRRAARAESEEVEPAPPIRYEPQDGFLSLMNTGDGRALLRWRSVVVHARWAEWLKDRIDRGFMRRYQRLERSDP